MCFGCCSLTPPVSQVSHRDAAGGLLLGPIAMDESVDVTDEESYAGNANDGVSLSLLPEAVRTDHTPPTGRQPLSPSKRASDTPVGQSVSRKSTHWPYAW